MTDPEEGWRRAAQGRRLLTQRTWEQQRAMQSLWYPRHKMDSVITRQQLQHGQGNCGFLSVQELSGTLYLVQGTIGNNRKTIFTPFSFLWHCALHLICRIRTAVLYSRTKMREQCHIVPVSGKKVISVRWKGRARIAWGGYTISD